MKPTSHLSAVPKIQTLLLFTAVMVALSPSQMLLACDEDTEAVDPSLAFPLRAERILFLGDSITNAGHYVAQIETQLRLQGLSPMPQIINIGLPSETCSGLSEPDHPFPRPNVHERLDRALAKVQPDVVVACYGMNDGIYYPFGEGRFQAYQQGLNGLIKKVHAAGARLVLVTPPPFDPVPLKGTDKLRPKSAERFAWFAIYEDYDRDVIDRYAEHVMTLSDKVEMVVDVHTPLHEFLAEQRKQDPQFHVAADGVHMNEVGHQIMATAILQAWGVHSSEPVSDELRRLMKQKESVLHDAWLTDVGHQRPQTKVGLPLQEAQQQAEQLETKISPLIQQAVQPRASRRSSTGGTVHQVHFPASLQPGSLKLYVDFYLWIPDDVAAIRGVIVHQHGCGPGASIGGQTAAADLHWQALAKKHSCALLGSSYEPRRGVDCRLWCDARQGSADRFLHALQHFAAATGYPEIDDVPWCLWGHSGGGFWASLMQTLYPERIAAIWLQSGTAFGYWTAGEIEVPKIPEAAYGVPVIGCPGQKEKTHERFHRAWDGIVAMRKAYLNAGASFFEFAPDPRTGHECGDSRYLSIPFFDFWLTARLSGQNYDLRPIDADMLTKWQQSMSRRLDEFVRTGSVQDATAPPAPTGVSWNRAEDGSLSLSWSAAADFESGLRTFAVERDGKLVDALPQNERGRFGRTLFQGLSYHDTPTAPLPQMQWTDPAAPADRVPAYRIRSVNSVGLKSDWVPATPTP